MKALFLSLIIFNCSKYFFITEADSCKDQLISIIKEYNSKVKNVKVNEVVYVHYKVNTTLRSKVNKAGVQEVKAYIGKNKSKVVNEYTEVYSNSEYTISVLPKDKVLLITNLPKNHDEEWRNNSALSMLDSIFNYYTIGDCSKTKNGLTQISLMPNTKAKNKFNVRSVDISLDENLKNLRSVKMNMDNKGDIESMQIEYLSYEINEIKSVSFPAMPDNFIKNGKPTEKFKSYKIIDKSKKRS